MCLVLAFTTVSCTDDDGGLPPLPSGAPRIDQLVPARTVVSDTVRVEGADFGSEQGDARVFFTGSDDRVMAGVLGWADDSIRVLVPFGARSGPVVVVTPDHESNDAAFDPAPAFVSYAHVAAVFVQHGCTGCHGGRGGLVLDSYANLMSGTSNHGPVVVPRQSGASPLVQKLRDPAPFGDRMPQFGAPIADQELLVIRDWIDQGARDN